MKIMSLILSWLSIIFILAVALGQHILEPIFSSAHKNVECAFLFNTGTQNDVPGGCIFVGIQASKSDEVNFLQTHSNKLDMNAIEIIEFYNSSLYRIPKKLLKLFARAEVLDVSYTSLVNISGLDSGKFLRIIKAAHNKIQRINENVFRQNLDLEFLDLSYNELFSFKMSLVAKNFKLIYLSLSYNRIHSFESGSTQLKKLKEIDLSYNFLRSITKHDLKGMKNLKILKLNNNLLKSIEIHVQSNLNMLFLQHNQLSELSLKCDENPSFLDVSNNNLKKLRIQNNFTVVDASYNHLTSLSLDVVPIEINELHLSHNLISDLNKIRSIHNLKKLILSHNVLSNINGKTFRGLNNLYQLELASNHINYLNLHHFADMEQLMFLDVTSNNISRIHYNSKDLKTLFPSLQSLSIGNNPWGCKYLVKLLYEFLSHNISLNSGNIEFIGFEHNVMGIPCYSRDDW